MKRIILGLILTTSVSSFAKDYIGFEENCYWSGKSVCEKEYFVTTNEQREEKIDILESYQGVEIGSEVTVVTNEVYFFNDQGSHKLFKHNREITSQGKVKAIFIDGEDTLLMLADDEVYSFESLKL